MTCLAAISTSPYMHISGVNLVTLSRRSVLFESLLSMVHWRWLPATLTLMIYLSTITC